MRRESKDDCEAPLVAAAAADQSGNDLTKHDKTDVKAPEGITSAGLKVLALLAVQNCSKNLVMRYAVQDKPDFLYSAAVIGSELTKLTLSMLWILFVDKGTPASIFEFLKRDWWNAVLLAVPAAVYNLQQTLEYVALSNLDAAVFSVLVQSKLICTAIFSVVLMKKVREITELPQRKAIVVTLLVCSQGLRKSQVISLVLLTCGVMLANIKCAGGPEVRVGVGLALGGGGLFGESWLDRQQWANCCQMPHSPIQNNNLG